MKVFWREIQIFSCEMNFVLFFSFVFGLES